MSYDNESSDSGFMTFILIVLPLVAGGVGVYFWWKWYTKTKPAMDALAQQYQNTETIIVVPHQQFDNTRAAQV